MEHINSEVVSTKTINNVTITLQCEWSIFNDKKNCVYYIYNSSESSRSLVYYKGEALNLFNEAVKEAEAAGK